MLTSILYYDHRHHSREWRNGIVDAVKRGLGIDTLLVNFFSSRMEDLAHVSHDRVVDLPTLVIHRNNDVVVRLVGVNVSVETIDRLSLGDHNDE